MSAPKQTSSQVDAKALQDKLWSVSLVLVIFISFMGNLAGNGLSNGVAALMVNANQSATLTGAVISAFSVVALVARLFGGPLIDRIGSRKVLLISFGELLVCSLVCLLTTDWAALVFFRAIMGIGFGFATTASDTATADVAPPSRLGEALGYQGLAYAVSLALSPSILIILAGYGRMILFGVVALIFTMGAILAFFIKVRRGVGPVTESDVRGAAGADSQVAAESEPRADGGSADVSAKPKRRIIAIEPHAVRTAIVTAIIYCATSLYMAYIPIFANMTGLALTTAYFCIAAAVMMGLRALCGKSFDKYPTSTLLVPALAAGIVGFLIMLFVPSNVTLCLAGVCYGIFIGIAQPVLTADAIRRSPIEHRGTAAGTFYIGGDVGVICGSALWGFIIDAGGFTPMFIVALCFLVAAGVATFTLLRTKR